MGKYEPLARFLRKQRTDEVPLTFAEIERIMGAKCRRARASNGLGTRFRSRSRRPAPQWREGTYRHARPTKPVQTPSSAGRADHFPAAGSGHRTAAPARGWGRRADRGWAAWACRATDHPACVARWRRAGTLVSGNHPYPVRTIGPPTLFQSQRPGILREMRGEPASCGSLLAASSRSRPAAFHGGLFRGSGLRARGPGRHLGRRQAPALPVDVEDHLMPAGRVAELALEIVVVRVATMIERRTCRHRGAASIFCCCRFDDRRTARSRNDECRRTRSALT